MQLFKSQQLFSVAGEGVRESTGPSPSRGWQNLNFSPGASSSGQVRDSPTAALTGPACSVMMCLSISERLETKECEREEVVSHQNGQKTGLTFMSEICLDMNC